MACDYDITKENIYDYIIEDTPGAKEAIEALSGICSQRADSQWIIAHGELPENRQLNISSLGYFTIPKLYGLMEADVDISALDEIGALRVLGQENLQADGSNVLIGYVDTGIDYLNDVFKDELGRTRIQAIWDQTDKTGEDGVNMYAHFGRVYEKDDIDRAIEADNNGGNPYSYVAQRDTIGHGTLLASISAGSYVNGYVGVAPKSELLVVKLKESKQYLKDFFLIKDDVPAFEEGDIMLAMRFLADYAVRLGKPLIIIFGLGSANGSRTGAAPLAEMMESLTKRPNISVVTCMGNEANNKCHYKGTVTSALVPDVMEVNVDGTGKGFTMEIWAESLDILSVSIESPSGEFVPRIPARMGASMEYTFLYEGSTVTVDYQITENVAGMEVIFIRLSTPVEGTWKFYIYSLTNIRGSYNAWLPLKQFSGQDIYFLKSDPDTTLTVPAAADGVISVGAYNHYTGAAYYESGRGYSADGRIKPDFVAPGVGVYGIAPSGGVKVTGTSYAAAYAGGCVALLYSYQINVKNSQMINHNDIKAQLIRGAVRSEYMVYPNHVAGYGKLNIYTTFNMMRIS